MLKKYKNEVFQIIKEKFNLDTNRFIISDFEENQKNPCLSQEYFEKKRAELKDEYEKLVARSEPNLGRIKPESFVNDIGDLREQLGRNFEKTIKDERAEAREDRLEFIRDLDAVGADAQAVLGYKMRIESLITAAQAKVGVCSSSSSSSSSVSSTPPTGTGSNAPGGVDD